MDDEVEDRDSDSTTMRVAKWINQKIKALAALDGVSVEAWNAAELGPFVEKRFRERMAQEYRPATRKPVAVAAPELGGEG